MMIIGPGLISVHYKGLLDKLGMQFDALRMGKCKGAYEPFTHEKMSPEVRENYQSVVDDIYDALVQAIAVGRRMEAGKVKKPSTAASSRPPGLKKQGLSIRVVATPPLPRTN